MTIHELLDASRNNLTIFDSFGKANDVINNPKYKKIMCSISGGSDSDIMLDLIYRLDKDKKVKYVWFDTGLEFQATKEHLRFLEKKYDISIERERAIQPIPTTCRNVGQPFLSKQVSEFMSRLQKHDFKWEDEPFDVLVKRYPKCKSALKWWCNGWGEGKEIISNEEKVRERFKTKFSISNNRYLKEFIMANPPTFAIANKCCTYAKKDVAKKFIKENEIDLNIVGVRKAEGGARSGAYKTCFSTADKKYGVDQYRPLFWYTDSDKKEYEEIFGVTHSECYTTYGMKRTGCAGCPYSIKIGDEKLTIQAFEPKLYKAINKIFKDSYEYTKQYREFVQMMDGKTIQQSLFDEVNE